MPVSTAANNAGTTPGLDRKVDVGELWPILRSRWTWVARSLALSVVLVLTYALITPPLYSSTAQILVDSRDRQVVSNEVSPGAIATDGGIVQAESQARVIESNSVLLRAIAATDLSHDPEFNRKSLLNRLLFQPAEKVTDADTETLLALRRKLAVKRADKVLVIDVVVTTEAADKSAKLANAIADSYLYDQNEAKAKASRDASEEISARLDGQRRRVHDAENTVETYKEQHHIVSAEGQLGVERELTAAYAQLSAARARSAELKGQIDQLDNNRRNGTGLDSSAEAVRSNSITSLRQQEALLVQQQAELQSLYGPRHPKIAEIEAQLSNLRNLITVELHRIDKASRDQYQRALASEQAAGVDVDRLKSRTLLTSQSLIGLRELERDLEASRSIYAAYLVRAQETREQSNVGTTNARIISRALPAPERSWPLIGLLLFGAICGGLGIGIAMAFLVEFWAPTASRSETLGPIRAFR